MTMRNVFIALMMILLSSCAAPKLENTYSETELAFSLNLFRNALISSPAGENVSVSPYSAGVALAMLDAGADEQTRTELDNALGGCSFIKQDLGSNDTVTVTSANSLWIDNDFSIRNTYVDILSKDYEAFSDALDFGDPETVKAINNWCSENTDGMIKGIISRLTPDMKLIIANALYFKGSWQDSFNPSDTGTGIFHGSKGDTRVSFMNKTLTCSYVEYEGNQMVKLPYEGGGYAMYVLLPSKNFRIDELVPYIYEDGFREVLDNMTTKKVRLSLPKFKVETEMSLVKTLQRMGVRTVFTTAADLSGIARGPLYVSDVYQKSVVNVDENGSEAAAVTAIMARLTSAGLSQNPVMNVDRPFYYMIADIQSDRVLFAGRIMNL